MLCGSTFRKKKKESWETILEGLIVKTQTQWTVNMQAN